MFVPWAINECLNNVYFYYSNKHGNTVVDIDIVTESDLGSFDPETLKRVIENTLRKATEDGNLGGTTAAAPNKDSISVFESSLGMFSSSLTHFEMLSLFYSPLWYEIKSGKFIFYFCSDLLLKSVFITTKLSICTLHHGFQINACFIPGDSPPGKVILLALHIKNICTDLLTYCSGCRNKRVLCSLLYCPLDRYALGFLWILGEL